MSYSMREIDQDRVKRVQQRVAALAARLSYKPGYRLLVERAEGRNLVVVLMANIPDSTGQRAPDQHLQTYTERVSVDEIDGLQDREILVGVFLPMLLRFEAHECGEWFKLDGCSVTDPHAFG